MSEVTVSSETECAGQAAYMLSLAEVYVTGCSTEAIMLVGATPDGVFSGGDSKKKTATRSSSINVGASFAAANGPTLTAGVTNNRGRCAEEAVGRWDISHHLLTSKARRDYLLDHSYVGGGSWKYIPNIENFGHVPVAKFKDDLSPSGIFRMEKKAPTRIDIKIISCWETQSGPANRWNALFKTILRRPAGPIPAFANFVCEVSAFINLEKAPDEDMFVLLDENYETTVGKEPQRFRTAKPVVGCENLEVQMVSAIMGEAPLSKTEHRHQGNILS
jgi:hypothetical protein